MQQNVGHADLLTQAEAAEKELAELHELAAIAPKLRAERDADRRAAEAAQAVSVTTQNARAAVQTAKPQLAQWRANFMTWVSEGFSLAKQLAQIEKPLTSALYNLIGAHANAQGPARDFEHAQRLRLQTEQHAHAALDGIGALSDELQPWPPAAGNQWAAELLTLMQRAVGNTFNPRAGVHQFRRGRPGT